MTDLKQPNIDAATLNTINSFISYVKQRYALDGAVLFGSYARHDARHDSDADVMLLLKGDHGDFIHTKLDLADIAFDVMLDTGIRIDPLPVWEDQWQNPQSFSNPALLANIQREGIVLQ
jgi:predicted nucleotidyltransferase